jgi:thioredoxin reductase (NADPH)
MAAGRRHQMFPVLGEEDIARLRRFGTEKSYGRGEFLFKAGEHSPGMAVLLSGRVLVTQRDGLGHISPIVELGPGEFTAEISQLSGKPALVDAQAVSDAVAILIPPHRLRAVFVEEADLGERIMRALILRRVALLESHTVGPTLIGPPSPDVFRLESFLSRNGFPYHRADPASDTEAAALLQHYAPDGDGLPLVICANGAILKNPSEAQLAKCIGMASEPDFERIYDVTIAGAGPAGLATAVYAASEGLSVIVLDARAFGGQAGASARIENYFGFPTGITGQALAGRGFVQAQKFGAEIAIPFTAARLDCGEADGLLRTVLDCGAAIKSRAVVVASGARYRRPAVPDLSSFEGRGIWFWASPIEAQLCKAEEVALAGGGNSAGQAAVYLSGFASKVHMLIRGDGLAATMSRYLIDRIGAAKNIVLHPRTEIARLEGTPLLGLQAIVWRSRDSGQEEHHPIRNVFLFIGAEPATAWLKDCGVALDAKGFVLTGPAAQPGNDTAGALEASIPGVFAVGDVRSGSVKRVGSAIGEGAAVVAALHGYLARQKE